METIKRFLTNPIVTGVLGLLIGVFIGLVILGWWLTPVQWTDAAPGALRSDAKVTYLRTCIDAYGYNGDAARAKACYDSLGADSAQALDQIVNNPATQDPKLVAAFGNIALAQGTGEDVAVAQPPVEGQPQPGETVMPLPKQGSQEEPAKSSSSSWLTLVCVGGLILAAILAVLALLNRFGILNLGGIFKSSSGGKAAPEVVEEGAEDTPPISRNIASYQLGNDLFDEVYSIEDQGEFLGEYGVAIADFGGVGGPKKVSAFEVWLFDKNHIPTTTKVLMSEQAFADSSRRQKLEAKGETLLAEPDRPVVLETNTLRLVARIVSMEYGQGASGSFFGRFVLELKVWQQRA
jgi:hypothetical protein